jgi:hypothetical protein
VFVSRRNGREEVFLGARASSDDGFAVRPLDELNRIAAGGVSSPEISADGTAIYFTADTVGDGNNDVFVSRRSGDTWGAPLRVAELSSPGVDDGDVAISPDGRTGMIARNAELLLVSRASTQDAFGAPVAVAALAIPGGAVAAPSITDRAERVYLHAGDPRDLYEARRSGDAFLPPVAIREINTAGRESAPFASADACRLVFARDRDIYEAMRQGEDAR